MDCPQHNSRGINCNNKQQLLLPPWWWLLLALIVRSYEIIWNKKCVLFIVLNKVYYKSCTAYYTKENKLINSVLSSRKYLVRNDCIILDWEAFSKKLSKINEFEPISNVPTSKYYLHTVFYLQCTKESISSPYFKQILLGDVNWHLWSVWYIYSIH